MPHTPENVAAAFIDAWNRHNMKAFGALFTEDANFVNVVGMWWTSRAAIEKAHQIAHESIFRNSRLEGRTASVIYLGAQTAAVHVSWTLTGQTQPDGSPAGTRRGILLLVVTEGPEGWRIKVAQNTDIVPGALTRSEAASHAEV